MTIQQAFAVALEHHQTGRLREAEAFYRQILAADPGHIDALHMLGLLAGQAGRPEVAADLLRQVIALKPDLGAAHCNLGNALRKNGLLDQSVAAYRQAITLMPGFAEAHSNLGTALYDKGQLDEAIASYRHAIALRPNYPEALSNLGFTLKEKGHLDEAIAACRRAIALKPTSPEAYSHLGIALYHMDRLDEAIAACRQAITVSPGFAKAHSNLGVALCGQGQVEAAIASYRQAIALDPDSAEAHYNLALVLLLQGVLPEGWEEYHWRWKLKEAAPFQHGWTQPPWDGSPLNGRTVFLHPEQGFGDALQFIRYVPLVARRGGRVVVGCPPELQRLFRTVNADVPVVAAGQTLPPFDVHCPLLSLPRLFATDLSNIPRDVPYLHANAEATAIWRERIGRDSASLKVGLVWAGKSTHKNDRNRSVRLASLAPLAGVPGVRYYSLQKGGAADEVKAAPAGMELIALGEDLKDFAETAALIANLDLVIAVDTAVAHLAGAMGKPVWVLLPFAPDWRWLLERSDSPWYPTMRLFRQSVIGDWGHVISEVRDQLQMLIHSRTGKP